MEKICKNCKYFNRYYVKNGINFCPSGLFYCQIKQQRHPTTANNSCKSFKKRIDTPHTYNTLKSSVENLNCLVTTLIYYFKSSKFNDE